MRRLRVLRRSCYLLRARLRRSTTRPTASGPRSSSPRGRSPAHAPCPPGRPPALPGQPQRAWGGRIAQGCPQRALEALEAPCSCATGSRAAPRRRWFPARDQPDPRNSSAPPPETVGSRFLSLLQSPPDQTLSAIFGTVKKPNCRSLLRTGLGGSKAERYDKLLSDGRSLSEAWGLAHLLYKLFWQPIQQLGLVGKAESRHPLRLPVLGAGHRHQLVDPAPTNLSGRWAQKLRNLGATSRPALARNCAYSVNAW